jgi:small GTP-binding protein
MEDRSRLRPAKVILLGDSSVGKTSIVQQFEKEEFDPSGEPTVGATYLSRLIETIHGTIQLHVWDTAGQERFKSILPMYIRGCDAVILVCSADSFDSFASLNSWLQRVDDTIKDAAQRYLVLNKIDKPAVYDVSAAETWAADHHFLFFKTCAKQHETISPLFETIAAGLISLAPVPPDVEPPPEELVHEHFCC